MSPLFQVARAGKFSQCDLTRGDKKFLGDDICVFTYDHPSADIIAVFQFDDEAHPKEAYRLLSLTLMHGAGKVETITAI